MTVRQYDSQEECQSGRMPVRQIGSQQNDNQKNDNQLNDSRQNGSQQNDNKAE
jgi:hypothetical protein